MHLVARAGAPAAQVPPAAPNSAGRQASPHGGLPGEPVPSNRSVTGPGTAFSKALLTHLLFEKGKEWAPVPEVLEQHRGLAGGSPGSGHEGNISALTRAGLHRDGYARWMWLPGDQAGEKRK